MRIVVGLDLKDTITCLRRTRDKILRKKLALEKNSAYYYSYASQIDLNKENKRKFCNLLYKLKRHS